MSQYSGRLSSLATAERPRTAFLRARAAVRGSRAPLNGRQLCFFALVNPTGGKCGQRGAEWTGQMDDMTLT